jgi:polynucleotide 5'-hydroxyl-kinase GRC3/NOL9
MTEAIDIPPAWAQLDLSGWRGVIMVIGGPDVGKSTLARYLYQRNVALGRTVAFLDGDPGQSNLGPPTTLTLATGAPGSERFPPQGRRWQSFVGSISPRGHMLSMVVGVLRLVQAARSTGVETIIHDTCGLVDPDQGGVTLKLAKIDAIRPVVVVALQREQELEPLLIPLRQSRRTRVVELRPSRAAQSHSRADRQAYRAARFADYFAQAPELTVLWTRFAIFPELRFTHRRLLALEDERGFCRSLGIVQHFETRTRQVTLQTPLTSLEGIDALRLGALGLHPETWQEQFL